MARRRRSFGLALGGGAARGIAHLGVLKALEERGLRADLVAGTSAGSIVGALYAGGHSYSDVAEIVRTVDWNDLVQPCLPRLGLVRADKLERRVDELLGGRSFDELDIPFAAVAVDLVSGTEVVISDGNVAAAVRASCSIPGIFEPVVDGSRVLVDGGVLNDVPADVALSMGADCVLAVDLNSDMLSPRVPESVFQVIIASFSVLARARHQQALDDPRVITVTPRLAEYPYHNMKPVDELIEAGLVATAAEIHRLMKKLRRPALSGPAPTVH